MIELINKIRELAKQSNTQLDLMDIGCTITNVMNESQVADLLAMTNHLEQNSEDKSALFTLSNILHDINGFRAIYFKESGSSGFSPRSKGYTKK